MTPIYTPQHQLNDFPGVPEAGGDSSIAGSPVPPAAARCTLALLLTNFHEVELSFLKDPPPFLPNATWATRKRCLSAQPRGSPRPTPTDDGEEPGRTPHSGGLHPAGPVAPGLTSGCHVPPWRPQDLAPLPAAPTRPTTSA